MAKAAQPKFFTRRAAVNPGLPTAKRHVDYLVKAATQARALALLELVKVPGRGHSLYYTNAREFRLYWVTRSTAEADASMLELSCDALEGIWWKPDMDPDSEYVCLWYTPITE
jgi:hypothetical protein